jgi:hypothetical protein
MQGCGLNSLYTGQTELLETVEANNDQDRWIQVFLRKGKDFRTVRVTGENDLRKQLEGRWGIESCRYRLSPAFDCQKSGAGYSVVMKIQGGEIYPMTELRPKFG